VSDRGGEPDEARAGAGLVARAQALLDLNRAAEAAAMLGRAAADDPDDPIVHALLAQALLTVDPAAAVRAAERAVALAPAWAWPARVGAIALLEADDPRRAREWAVTAVTLDPADPAGHTCLGRVALANGDPAAAIAATDHALGLDPAFLDAWSVRGLTLLRMQRNEEAAGAFRRVLAEHPDDPAALNNLGAALQSLGRRQEALELFARASALNPGDDVARSNADATARSFGAIGIAGALGAFVVLRIAVTVGGSWGPLGAALGLVAVVGALAAVGRFRLRRDLERMPPHLRGFVADQRRRRARPRSPFGWSMIGAVVVVTLLVVIAAVTGDG
jgi:tetratricopeptide (TPR) repeat protein